MPKLRILSVGKNKERWLNEAFDEYVKRLKPSLSVECLWVQNDAQLLTQVAKEKHVICLDPAGNMMDSIAFSQFFQKQIETSGGRITLVIGGPDGIPNELKCYPLISLSPLTFTHQMTRLVLIEQIYRAIEIEKGSKYHRF